MNRVKKKYQKTKKDAIRKFEDKGEITEGTSHTQDDSTLLVAEMPTIQKYENTQEKITEGTSHTRGDSRLLFAEVPTIQKPENSEEKIMAGMNRVKKKYTQKTKKDAIRKFEDKGEITEGTSHTQDDSTLLVTEIPTIQKSENTGEKIMEAGMHRVKKKYTQKTKKDAIRKFEDKGEITEGSSHTQDDSTLLVAEVPTIQKSENAGEKVMEAGMNRVKKKYTQKKKKEIMEGTHMPKDALFITEIPAFRKKDEKHKPNDALFIAEIPAFQKKDEKHKPKDALFIAEIPAFRKKDEKHKPKDALFIAEIPAFRKKDEKLEEFVPLFKKLQITPYKRDGFVSFQVSGMVHLLSGYGASKDHLHKSVRDVYHNFTSIHKLAISLLGQMHLRFPENNYYIELRKEMGFLITACRSLLKWIFEIYNTSNSIVPNYARLLAEVENQFLQLVKDCTNQLSSSEKSKNSPGVLFSEMEHMRERIENAYLEKSSLCFQLLTSDMMVEFLDQLLEDMDCLYEETYVKTMKEKITLVRGYLKLVEGRIFGVERREVLIPIEHIAYEVAKCSFSIMYYRRVCGIATNLSKSVFIILVSKLRYCKAPFMADELLVGYVKCIQENILELLKDKMVDLYLLSSMQDDVKILLDALSFMMHFLLRCPKMKSHEQSRLSDARVEFQDLAKNIGFFIYQIFEDRHEVDKETLRKMSGEIKAFMEQVDHVKDEISKSICCIILERPQLESAKTDQLGFLILFLKNWKKFIDNEYTKLFDKEQENLIFFIFYLQNIESEDIEIFDYCKQDKQIKILLKKSNNFGRDFEEVKEILISAQVVAFKLACYSLLRRYGKIHWWELYFVTKERVDSHKRVEIVKLLVLSSNTPLTDDFLIAHVECVQDNLIELLREKAFVPFKNQFKILHEGLLFLGRLLISYRAEQEKLSCIKVRIQDLMRSIGSEICSCFVSGLWGYQVRIRVTELSNLVANLNVIKAETKEILPLVILNTIGRESPKTDQMGSLNLFLENWKGLVDCESDLIVTWKDQFQMIHENLVFFGSFITSNTNEDDESQNICYRIMDAGYVAEYLLNSFANGACPVWCTSLWISQFAEHIELIKAAVVEANMKTIGKCKEASSSTIYTSPNSSQALPVSASTDLLVGFDEEIKLIKDQLSSDLRKLVVIPITGMPGLGKTTLARQIYDDPFTVSHFDARAWCCVSQQYNTKELLLAILDTVGEITDVIKRNSTESQISTLVYQALMGRRYLIVLDDIWEIDAFMDLVLYFPDGNEGSRIMLTSRSKEIGLQVKPLNDPIEPGMLTGDQSWDLLERKIYNNGKCPLRLCHIGKQIAEKCRGLPLAVVLVGGLLAKSAQEQDFWEQVAINLSSYLARDSQSHFMAALELSYKFLPDSLKPLFLYLGAFPEDKEIPVNKLMWLWIAEGCVQKTEHRSLQIQAEIHLKDLIDRSLVMVATRRSDGGVKTCQVHDLLRDMCLAKAKEEKFMQQVHANNELSDPIMYQRRLSILFEKNSEISSRHFVAYQDLPMFSITPPIYSLLFFYVKRSHSLPEEDIKSIFSSLKLLKVFHAENVVISHEDLYNDLIMLVHLRYVSVRASLNSLPSSISRLQRLETLIVKGVKGEIDVPETIWGMTKMRHLHINARAKFSVAPDNPLILENLETLSTPVIDLGEEEELIRKVPGLRKLRCVFNEGIDYDRRIYEFPNLESLSKLESLKILYYGRVKCVGDFKLPLTLKKLSISKLRLKWSDVSMFMELSNLEVLKLRSGSVDDEFWDTTNDDEFTNLKFLKLENLNIKGWRASAENFPSLEKLVLESCNQLEEIPSDLGEFYSLRKIEVLQCPSATKMAKVIQKEQEENELLNVYIYPLQEED